MAENLFGRLRKKGLPIPTDLSELEMQQEKEAAIENERKFRKRKLDEKGSRNPIILPILSFDVD